jgi:hypothetical protein
MTFAINAVADGPNNYAAFQALAKNINGTTSSSPSTGSSTGASPTSTRTNGGVSVKRVVGASTGYLLLAFTIVLLS